LHLFPLFLKLRDRRCLVVGAGPISEGKIAGLLDTGAHVHVVAPKATPQILQWHKKKKIRLSRRVFRAKDLDGIFLVVAATNSPKVHRAIYREAQGRRVLCNIVDVPPLCDFYYPAVVRRGKLQIAISTAGSSPSLARRLREEMEVAFGLKYAEWLRHLSRERKKLLATDMPVEQRMQLLKAQASGEAFVHFSRQRSKAKRAPRTASKKEQRRPEGA
jgi:precorrin-2 dehydrogenase / sirohydrochlorin ferrochelatase